MAKTEQQLISYIAPGAPATRRPAEGDEAYLRPEVGFTPNWYRERLGFDFGKEWHTSPAYRRYTVLAMRTELEKTFPGANIGHTHKPLDILTGTFGANTIASIYNVPPVYAEDNWPACEHVYLSDEQMDALEPPVLDDNAFFQGLMEQVDWIVKEQGEVHGFINWQGVLNNAQRLRGEQLLVDMLTEPDRARHLFECVHATMAEAALRLHARQRESGVHVAFFTVSNCFVNMIAPDTYADMLLPFDIKLAERSGCLGVHNCAWSADPYMEHYASIPNLGYIDMGLESDLARARDLFPDTRRALMYTPMDLANKPFEDVRADLGRIAAEYGPCDVVVADIEAGVPDERVTEFLDTCGDLTDQYS